MTSGDRGPTMISVDDIAREQGLEPGEVLEFLHDFWTYTNGEELPALREAVMAGDFPSIKQVAHSIKGAALNLRLERIASLAREIEAQGTARSFDGVGGLMSELEMAVEELKVCLERLSLLDPRAP